MFLLEIINLIKMVPEAKLSVISSITHIPSKFQHKDIQTRKPSAVSLSRHKGPGTLGLADFTSLGMEVPGQG